MVREMRRAFTVVELLVVVGIISILTGILLPVVSKARAQSERVACRAQLRDVGASFTMYMTDSKGRLPAVNTMPSIKPPQINAPSLPVLLEPYVKTSTRVFRCPSDHVTKEVTNAPAGFETYFEREGSSYQYSPFLVPLAGSRPQESLGNRMGHPELVTVIDEYEPYHGPAGSRGAMNYLFMDMHVGSLGD